ncbi:leucyl/phenylalanyl-tRNA--protein transferase [Rhodanobacter ginsengiterrae]|uniref:leucyl/phenylalanyl-tRNA--protein transferase n=1 Tax=Rhodanobacter ginsengiterrae TaxID=2008451 RepID=UPI003CF64845
MIRLPLLDPDAWDRFPDPSEALTDPNGLLAFGGDLSPQRLLAAYRRGIFPWFSEGEPILWWSPDPRCVFCTADLYANRSLRRTVARKQWKFTTDRAFHQVMSACAEPRSRDSGSWIGAQMIQAYGQLHQQGHAHSVEVWDGTRLVGGIYGVAVGRMFCGESMFSRESNASKSALMVLAGLLRARGFPLIDAQVANDHTLSLGAREIPRMEFLTRLADLGSFAEKPGSWLSALELPGR